MSRRSGRGPRTAAWWSRSADGLSAPHGIPELAVALLPPYRGRGIGTQLLRAMLDELRGRGFAAVSLSVQRANPAVRLYRRLGFRVVETSAGEYVMRCDWR